MNKRERILEAIRVAVATSENGLAGRDAIRLYTENHISYSAFHAAVQQGQKQWQRRKDSKEETK